MVKDQQRFMDSLEKLRSGNKELDEVLKELSKLSRQLQELQASLMQFARQIPNEFVNPANMRNMPFADMQSMMDQIRQKLREGDIEGALQMARELFNQMAQLGGFAPKRAAAGPGIHDVRMQGAMSRSNDELQQIVREQQEILLGTESTHKESTREIDERREKALVELAEKRAGRPRGARPSPRPSRPGERPAQDSCGTRAEHRHPRAAVWVAGYARKPGLRRILQSNSGR